VPRNPRTPLADFTTNQEITMNAFPKLAAAAAILALGVGAAAASGDPIRL
jgi:hypothetical protein